MSTRYAILGLLSQKSMHGYELKKEFEQSVSFIWSINIGQLYTLLKKMEEDKAIVKETVCQENRPDKLVYQITDKGKEELQSWLCAPVVRKSTKDEFFLKMMFLRQVDTKEARKIVDEQIDSMEKQLNELKMVRDTSGDKMDKFMGLLLEASIRHFEVDIEWLRLYKERMGL